jgi:hypothetical protein
VLGKTSGDGRAPILTRRDLLCRGRIPFGEYFVR